MMNRSNTKSVEYRLLMRRGTHAKRRINNQFLITGFGITVARVQECLILTSNLNSPAAYYTDRTGWPVEIAFSTISAAIFTPPVFCIAFCILRAFSR
ncbi:MAG: hypothetical protein EWV40_00515 [Microcystis flos-aquae Mf_WU_F_19750830_S460]|uniref:Uncharacterized protein n=1 Tax=Microcystis flos-aquae Mf_WU_F_19750830_S460 TaxID=2486237 RepID=A0A552M5Q3_9CHRO|nr:MAG: hypothetical protein EWV40_00515 [Microcystis flos-aquae Mf_WU_F_19750830_S460]